MSCQNCNCCDDPDMKTVEHIADNAQAQGNYFIAEAIRAVLSKCKKVQHNLNSNDKEYVRDIAEYADSPSWSYSDRKAILMDAQHLIQRAKREPEQPRILSGFRAMLDEAFSKPLEQPVIRQVINSDVTFPEICTEECAFFRHCPYGREGNLGQICVNRVKKNR